MVGGGSDGGECRRWVVLRQWCCFDLFGVGLDVHYPLRRQRQMCIMDRAWCACLDLMSLHVVIGCEMLVFVRHSDHV